VPALWSRQGLGFERRVGSGKVGGRGLHVDGDEEVRARKRGCEGRARCSRCMCHMVWRVAAA
jgi:hypothetical protein